MKNTIILLFILPISLFAQKWDKYLLVSAGSGAAKAVEQNTYPRSSLQNDKWGFTGNLGFRADYNSNRQITWGTGVELNLLKGSSFFRAYSTFIGVPPYIRSDFNATFINVPIHLLIKTNSDDRNYGYFITSTGISYSPFGWYRNSLVKSTSDLSEMTINDMQSGTYSFESMATAFISAGIGANFMIATRSFLVELSCLTDVMDWKYLMDNPYSNRSVSESFRRQMIQLKFGIRLNR